MPVKALLEILFCNWHYINHLLTYLTNEAVALPFHNLLIAIECTMNSVEANKGVFHRKL